MNLSMEQYMLVMLANTCGKDKVEWQDRIDFADNLLSKPKQEAILEAETKELPMFNKYWDFLSNGDARELEYMPVSLDCTASCLQLYSLLTGCTKTAKATNVIGNSINDAYSIARNRLVEITGETFTRKQVKDAVMPTFYESKAEPKRLIGEDYLGSYYAMLEEEFPGACMALEAITDSWRSDQDFHEWYLPDGFHVYVPVEGVEEYSIDIPEWGVTVPYRQTVQTKKEKGISLAANVIQSIDAYVVRRVLALADFPIWPIHDCFTVKAVNANELRVIITNVYREIADSDLLSDIISQIRGVPFKFEKLTENISSQIEDHNYIIC